MSQLEHPGDVDAAHVCPVPWVRRDADGCMSIPTAYAWRDSVGVGARWRCSCGRAYRLTRTRFWRTWRWVTDPTPLAESPETFSVKPRGDHGTV